MRCFFKRLRVQLIAHAADQNDHITVVGPTRYGQGLSFLINEPIMPHVGVMIELSLFPHGANVDYGK